MKPAKVTNAPRLFLVISAATLLIAAPLTSDAQPAQARLVATAQVVDRAEVAVIDTASLASLATTRTPLSSVATTEALPDHTVAVKSTRTESGIQLSIDYN